MKNALHWFSLAMFLNIWHSSSVQAASFDCDKAHSRQEHIICGNQALGRLDEKLDNTYRLALERAADLGALIQSQREWIRRRNQCADAVCLSRSYTGRLVLLRQVKLAGWGIFSDPDLGISFEYRKSRQVKKPCPYCSGEQCVALVGRNMGNSDYIIAFKVVKGDLEHTAIGEAGFEKEDGGKWVTSFGMGPHSVVEFFGGKGWKGMKAMQVCEVIDPYEGELHAIGDCFRAVLSNGKRSVVADTEGIISADVDTMRTVKSIRFIR